MDWKTILSYISGSVDEELLLRNEYLVAENRVLRNQLQDRLPSCLKIRTNSRSDPKMSPNCLFFGCPFHILELYEIGELPATRMLWSSSCGTF